MKQLVLWPTRPRVSEADSKWIKKVVIPNQSMTLKEILRRFVKRESLPTEKQGIYAETDYDLEKLAKEDRVVQGEVLEDIKKSVARKKKVAEDMERAAKEPIPKQSDPKEVLPPKQP